MLSCCYFCRSSFFLLLVHFVCSALKLTAILQMMRKELESGGRVFVVYPVIELSEELPELRAAETEYKILMEEFEDFQCGLVHGRMKVFDSTTTSVAVSMTC
jgi:RecG-like helicase